MAFVPDESRDLERDAEPTEQILVAYLPALGRNDKCVIGNNCKHKQSCGSMPSVPVFNTNMCWAVLCESLADDRLQEILDSKRLPDGSIVTVAERLLEIAPERVCALIEPHFAGAQRPSPDDPSLSHLEVVMMPSQGRHAEARERARFWIAKLQRHHDREVPAAMMVWLRNIADGQYPDQAMATLTADGLSEWSQRLVAAIKSGLAHPANNKHLSLEAVGAAADEKPASPDALKKALRQPLKKMGIAKDQIAAQVEILLAQINALPATAASVAGDKPDGYRLKSSAVMEALEADWHRAWPLAKPFSRADTARNRRHLGYVAGGVLGRIPGTARRGV